MATLEETNSTTQILEFRRLLHSNWRWWGEGRRRFRLSADSLPSVSQCMLGCREGWVCVCLSAVGTAQTTLCSRDPVPIWKITNDIVVLPALYMWITLIVTTIVQSPLPYTCSTLLLWHPILYRTLVP